MQFPDRSFEDIHQNYQTNQMFYQSPMDKEEGESDLRADDTEMDVDGQTAFDDGAFPF